MRHYGQVKITFRLSCRSKLSSDFVNGNYTPFSFPYFPRKPGYLANYKKPKNLRFLYSWIKNLRRTCHDNREMAKWSNHWECARSITSFWKYIINHISSCHELYLNYLPSNFDSKSPHCKLNFISSLLIFSKLSMAKVLSVTCWTIFNKLNLFQTENL